MIRFSNGKAVLKATEGFGMLPRIEANIRRLVVCPHCKLALEAEIDVDVEAVLGKPLANCMSVYDPASSYLAERVTGTTIFVTNSHHAFTDALSRTCGGGAYAGNSLVSVHTLLWRACCRVATSAEYALERGRAERALAAERMSAQQDGDLMNLPAGVGALVPARMLRMHRAPEATALSEVLNLPCVVRVNATDESDGHAYLVDMHVFHQHFNTPFAPELLLARLGGASFNPRPRIGEALNPGIDVRNVSGYGRFARPETIEARLRRCRGHEQGDIFG